MTNTDLIAKTERIMSPKDYRHGVSGSRLSLNSVVFFTRNDLSRLMCDQKYSHCHHRYVLFVNLKTDGAIWIDGELCRVMPRHAFLICPYQSHYFCREPGRDAIRWLFVGFEAADHALLADLRNCRVPFSVHAVSLIDMLIDAYLPACTGDETRSSQTVCLLEALILELRASMDGPVAAGTKPIHDPTGKMLESVTRIVYANACKMVTIREIAGRVGVCESRLRMAFKERLGMSLGRFMRQVRIEKAAQLVASPGCTLSEVADQTGFSSVHSFSRAFKRSMGMNPSFYRKKRWNADE